MKQRRIRNNVMWMGAVDWNRRVFDSLIPIPEGTSYNAYLVQGSEKTALLDTVDASMTDVLMYQLEAVPKLDYIVSQHAEQDHSGAIPAVLQKYPEAVVICTPKAKGMLEDHLRISPDKIRTVENGDSISLGDKSLHFIHTPWVHWPETMSTYLPEDRILFTCDFFGAHFASSEQYAGEEPRVFEEAKRYYAEIMMPFRAIIQKNLEKISAYRFDLIAPSHGPIHDKPEKIVGLYRQWVSDKVDNLVVIPYVSMHGSTEKMVKYLAGSLTERGVAAHIYDITVTDIGKLAMSLVDAATLVIGTSTVHAGPHPYVYFAAHLANAVRPKLKYAAVIGSFGWGSNVAEQVAGLIPNLKVEILNPVLCKGLPGAQDYEALDALADTILGKHLEFQKPA